MPIRPKWCVKQVVPRRDYTLSLTFENGEQRIYDAKALLKLRPWEKLNNIDFFMLAHVEYATVVWNEDVDIDPEELYAYSKPITI